MPPLARCDVVTAMDVEYLAGSAGAGVRRSEDRVVLTEFSQDTEEDEATFSGIGELVGETVVEMPRPVFGRAYASAVRPPWGALPDGTPYADDALPWASFDEGSGEVEIDEAAALAHGARAYYDEATLELVLEGVS